MSKTVTKKILPEYFKAVKDYRKTFELRKDDDNFEVGDTIRLAEWDGEKFTGNICVRLITYILRDCPEYGLMPGYCILGVQSETEVFERKIRQKTEVVLDKVEASQEMEKAHWIKSYGIRGYACSNCLNRSMEQEAYCDWCKAKMEGKTIEL